MRKERTPLQAETATREVGNSVGDSPPVGRVVRTISVAIEIIGDITPIRPRMAERARIVHSDRSPFAFGQRMVDPVLVALLLPAVCMVLGQPFDRNYQVLAVFGLLGGVWAFRTTGLYGRDGRRGAVATIVRVWVAWLCVVALLVGIGVLTGSTDEMAIQVLVVWALIAPVALSAAHLAAAGAMRGLRTRGFGTRSAVMVGAGPTAREFAQRLMDSPSSGIRLLGYFDDREPSGGTGMLPLLGSLNSLPDFIKAKRVDHVYMALPMGGHGRAARLAKRLLDTTVSVSFLPQVLSAGVPTLHIEEVAGIPLFTSRDTPFADWGRRLAKRASDIVMAGVGVVVAAPIMAVVALGVKLTSRGPVLFRQRRHGLDGTEIVVYKFRSMTVMEDGAEVIQARRNDPRVTRLGRFLRGTSLDELPQLINVLQGRMSMIGPRPHALTHNDYYRELISGYAGRHKIKPGLSGWAQVHGHRGETSTVDAMRMRVEHDLYYMRNWSLWMDLRIAVKTLVVLFKHPKAY
ncbi:MAG TPA: undecaprenyl-phosphate glucose phosphotransferase [Kofleriaceae bacterium]|nr:undecaprenyl-phosphate glucose phosphotransferase [Kofleriaceae bacterium]